MNHVVGYQRVADDGASNEMTFFKYGVSREGGSFQCTLYGMGMFPLFTDMAYGKMIAGLLLERWSKIHNGVMSVAGGAMLFELKQKNKRNGFICWAEFFSTNQTGNIDF